MEFLEDNEGKTRETTGKKKFEVEIIETLSMIVEVEAENESEAERIVHDKYMMEEYVLTSDNHIDTEIKIFRDC